MNQKIRFAVVGLGHIGKRHAALIYENKNAVLSAVADMDEEALRGAMHEFNTADFNSLESLLAGDIGFDVLNICTPNGFHCQQALTALNHGKHVVIEKPMGLHVSECKEVIEASRNNDCHVFCVMQNRYTPTAKWLKKIMDENVLGNIYLVSINCFWNRDERYYSQPQKLKWRGTLKYDGGPLFTQFSHFIDLLVWVFGEVNVEKVFFGSHRNFRLTEFTDDSGSVYFKLKNGGEATFQYSTDVWDKNLESSITVIAENGSLKIGGQYMERLEYCHIKNYETPSLDHPGFSNQYPGYTGSAANHHFVIQNVIDVLSGTNSIDTSAEDGMRVVKLIEEIYAERK